MPWYWIVVIISAIVGPFETAYAYSKLLKRRKKFREEKLAREAEARDDPGHLS